MKRILFILHTPPPVHGASIVGGYIRQSTVINTALSCRYINLGTSRTVDEIGKNPLAKSGRYLMIMLRELWQLVVFRPHTVYLTISASGAGFYKDFPIAMLAGLLGAKRLYHFHNKGISERQHKKLDNMLCRMLFYKAEVILLSKYLYNDIAKYVPEESVSYCANGVGSEAVSSKQQVVSSKRIEILFLSNLIESKGVYVLLDACELLNKKGLDYSCIIVGGEGDITAGILNREIQSRGLAESVYYAGKQYGADKDALLIKADIFTLPTFYSNECMPLVILEAMQHALPVVSTTEGAIPEIVSDGATGFLVPCKDAVALADKLELLINDKQLREAMGQEGRRKFETEYTLNAFELRLKAILDE